MLVLLLQNDLTGTATDTPLLFSAVVAKGGGSISFYFNTPVTFGAGGNPGFATSLSGGACTLTYSSGDTSTVLVYTTSRTVGNTESGTVDYTQPGNGIESVSDNTDLATFTGLTVSGLGLAVSSGRRLRLI